VKVHELVAEALTASGVSHVFTVMGDGNLDLLDAFARRGVRLVHARHEQGAVAMADGYARASGTPGVCSVTHGAGITQTATSLHTARAYGTPVLLVAGDTPAADAGRAGAFDQLAFGRLVAGAAWTLQSGGGATAALAAIGERLRDGPAVLNLPTDVQRDEAGPGAVPRLMVPPLPRPDPAPAAVERAVAALGAAARPAILAGRGAAGAGAGIALARLADRLGAPIATTLLAHGFCADHPRHVGVSGSLGDGRGSDALREADCVYAAGTSLSSWTLGGRPLDAHVVRVDAEPSRLAAGGADTPVLADARLATEQVLAGLGPGRVDRPLPPPRPEPDAFDDGTGTVDPRRALLALDRALAPERRLVIDGGHFAIFASQLLTVHGTAQFGWTSDFGAIGQGLGIAIGAAIAGPPRTTLVAGDGGFLMAIAELETAARYAVPLTMFVMNDDGYGQERHNMRAKGLDASHAVLRTPDLAALAQATGAAGHRIDSPAALESLAPALADATGPLVLDVRINGDVVNPSSAEIAAALRGEG